MKKQVSYFMIIKNRRLNERYCLLKMWAETTLPPILPAQFVEVRIGDESAGLLRRPFSVHDVNYEKNTISLLVQVVGRNTRALSEMKVGRMLSLIFPLGNSFSLPVDGTRVLLVGGGCGIAPLLYTAKYFTRSGHDVSMLLGFRSKNDIILKDKYAKYGNVFYTTDDGSCGEQGTVLQHSIFGSDTFAYDRIYACGPKPMLHSLASWTTSHNVECFMSLENKMACGIGACLCCVQQTVDGHKCVCSDGPVFNAKDIIW